MTTTDNNEDNNSNKDETTARASSSSSSKWDRNASKFITIIGFAVNLVNYLDRAVIGAAAGQIISEFQLSSSQKKTKSFAYKMYCNSRRTSRIQHSTKYKFPPPVLAFFFYA